MAALPQMLVDHGSRGLLGEEVSFPAPGRSPEIGVALRAHWVGLRGRAHDLAAAALTGSSRSSGSAYARASRSSPTASPREPLRG